MKADDLMAYIAAVAANPAYTARFAADLAQPGLRIPLTADGATFAEAVELGRTVIWLHTFGERFADPVTAGRRNLPGFHRGDAPQIPKGGAIPDDPAAMPDTIAYDATTRRLLIGQGHVEHVTPEMSGLRGFRQAGARQWFSYRKANRERPIIGDRRPPRSWETSSPITGSRNTRRS